MTDRLPRRRSGAYVPDSQRHTARLTLRMPPDRVDAIRAYADAHGLTLAEAVWLAVRSAPPAP